MNTVTIDNPTQYDAIREVLVDRIVEVGYSCGMLREHPSEYYIRFKGSEESSKVVSLAYVGQELDLRFDDDGFDSPITQVYRLRVEHSVWWEDCDQDTNTYNAWLSNYNAFMKQWGDVTNTKGGDAQRIHHIQCLNATAVTDW